MDGSGGRFVVIGVMLISVIGSPLAVKPVTPAGIFTVTSPSAEDAVAAEIKVPEEFSSLLKSVVPDGSVGVVVVVVVVGVVVVGVVVVVFGGVVVVVVGVVVGVVAAASVTLIA